MSRASWLYVLCAVSAHAHASPRSDPTLGRAVFTGAVSANPTSIDVNPSAIGLSVKSELYVAMLGVLDQYSVDLDDVDPVDATTASPGMTFAAIWKTGAESRFTVGVELFRWTPSERFIEDDRLRYHTGGGYHRVFQPVLGAASVRVTNRFYVGASLGLQNQKVKLRWSRDTALEAGRDPDRGVDSDCDGAPCGIGNPAASEDYEVIADYGMFSEAVLVGNLGAVVRLAKDTWIGLSWHTPPGLAVQNELTGTMEIERAPRDGGVALAGGATVYISQPASFDLGFRSRIREALDLHVGARWEHLSRFQAYDVRGYGSTLPPAGVPEWQPRPRGFHSTYALWAGMEQVERTSPFIFGGRIGLETSALDDDRTSPLTIAPASVTVDGGAQWRIAESWLVLATYGLQYFPTVDVDASAFDPDDRLACIDSGYDYTLPACASVRGGYAIASAAGSYSRIQHALRLAVRIELD
jgi:long-subunit fatty acid transport protein